MEIGLKYFFKQNTGGTGKFYFALLIQTEDGKGMLLKRYGPANKLYDGGSVSFEVMSSADAESGYRAIHKAKVVKGGYSLAVTTSPALSEVFGTLGDDEARMDMTNPENIRLIREMLTQQSDDGDAAQIMEDLRIVNFSGEPIVPVVPFDPNIDRGDNWGGW